MKAAEPHRLLLLLDVHDNNILSTGEGDQVLPQCVKAVYRDSDNKFTSSQLFFVTLSCSHRARTGEREMQLFQGLSTPPKPLSFCGSSLWKLSKVKLCRLNKKGIKTWGWRRLVLLNKTRVQEVYEKYIGTNVWHTGDKRTLLYIETAPCEGAGSRKLELTFGGNFNAKEVHRLLVKTTHCTYLFTSRGFTVSGVLAPESFWRRKYKYACVSGPSWIKAFMVA